jgi:hypothetical protein
MLVVTPSEDVERSTTTVEMPGGRKITIDVCKRTNTDPSLKEIHKQVAVFLKDFARNTGPWPHGDRCTVFVWSGSRSMEYDGATTTSIWALEHELYHSYFGRGVKPRSQNDGWFDEAWTVFLADERRASKKVLEGEGRATVLCSDDPWNRITPNKSYSVGAVAFGRIAHVIGEKKLVALMASFFDEYRLRPASTADMEAFLYAATGEDAVKQVFHRYVYGREGGWSDPDSEALK